MSARPAATAPLLSDAEVAALIARGRRLARGAGDRPADGGRHGGAASRHAGGGLDFAEHRRYLPGDDVRRIDWRLTARIGQPHVRRYHEDLVPDCLILVDRRATMRFATRGRLKAAQAVRLGLLLAAYHAARQAPLTCIELDTRLQRHGPLGDLQLPALGHGLARRCPPLANPGPTLTEALVQLDHLAPPGSRVVLLSDFNDADAVPSALWQRLAHRHRVQAVRIEDPAERELPAGQRASLCWPRADGEHCLPLAPALRARLQDRAASARDALTGTLRQAGIALYQLGTEAADPLAALGGPG